MSQDLIDYNAATSYFKREFQLCYQPVMSLETQSLYAFESFTYWQPDRAKLYSANPLTSAEKSQLDMPFHQWVLDEACRQLQSWQIKSAGDVLSCLSLDISTKPLFCSYFAEYIAQLLDKIGVAPDCLQLEIPAKWAMQNRLAAKSAITRFKQAGISICIDDVHFSDLSYEDWFSLPIKVLKISKINTNGLLNNFCMKDFLKTTLSIARKANIQVVAKGIETDEQLAAMKTLGCAYGQGCLLSKPLLPRHATALISSQTSRESKAPTDYLTVMTILNKTAQIFLGGTLTTKYWNETKPKRSWLITMEAYKKSEPFSSLEKLEYLDIYQQQDLTSWIDCFIKRCSAIIFNFPKLAQANMTPTEVNIFKDLCPTLL